MAPANPTRDVETLLFASGAQLVIGMDEVGRGSIAGPVGVGVCVLHPDTPSPPEGLRDSKLLSEKRRTALYPLLQQWAPAWAVGYATAEEIDQSGITKALAFAGRRALADIATQFEQSGQQLTGVILLDGSHNWLGAPPPGLSIQVRVKADRDCESVAAASVLAKVTRDRLMINLDERHPGYGWASNKGYGAATHYDGLKLLGPVPSVHRMTWI
jgi:ribonuclease HII